MSYHFITLFLSSPVWNAYYHIIRWHTHTRFLPIYIQRPSCISILLSTQSLTHTLSLSYTLTHTHTHTHTLTHSRTLSLTHTLSHALTHLYNTFLSLPLCSDIVSVLSCRQEGARHTIEHAKEKWTSGTGEDGAAYLHPFSSALLFPLTIFSLSIQYFFSLWNAPLKTHTLSFYFSLSLSHTQRLLVSVDRWPADSLSPLGHYVRVLGKDGQKDVETQVT